MMKKLELKKNTITRLNQSKLDGIRGGATDGCGVNTDTNCVTLQNCNSTLCQATQHGADCATKNEACMTPYTPINSLMGICW